MLLHTWSLGVEEQFYVLLPPLILLLFRKRWKLSRVLIVGLPLAFALSVWLSYKKPSFAFYLLPARVWELGLGVALAADVISVPKNMQVRSWIAIFGLAIMFASFFLVDNSRPFPGWLALAPCGGAAAVILCVSKGDWVWKILTLPVVRFLGMISYSLYLWHWPVFVSLRMFTASPYLNTSYAIFGVALSILLAWLSWKFVESPFRSRAGVPARRAWSLTVCSAVVIGAIAAFFIAQDGFPDRLNADTKKLLAAASDLDPLRKPCQNNWSISRVDCIFGDPGGPVDFVLVGDSHAGAIRPAIERWAKSSGRSGSILWRGACSMFLGARLVEDPDAEYCDNFKELVVQAIEKDSRIKTVIIGGRWEVAFTGYRPESGGSYRNYMVDNIDRVGSLSGNQRVFERSLMRLSERLQKMDIQIIYLGAVPEVGFDVPRILALASRNQGDAGATFAVRPANVDLREELDRAFERIALGGPRRRYISMWRSFCIPECQIVMDGIPIYSDYDHLTQAAAREFVGPMLEQALNIR